MKKSTQAKISIVVLIISIIICAISVICIAFANTKVVLIRWFFTSIVSVSTVAFSLAGIFPYWQERNIHKRIKKILTFEYVKVHIADTDYIPLCIKLALTENNITFYAKLRRTKSDELLVCIAAKKDEKFFAEEILTEDCPIFMECNDFLRVFERENLKYAKI